MDKYVEGLKNFLDASPVNYYAIKNVEETLLAQGFMALDETKPFDLVKGQKYFVKRNGSSIIAFTLPSQLKKEFAYHIVASHSDSPCFKVKLNCDNRSNAYDKISVEPYGGMIVSSWLDRPLSLAGRIFIKRNQIEEKLINLTSFTAIIPNLCIHFNPQMNDGYRYSFDKDMQPFYSESDTNLKKQIIKYVDTSLKESEIISYDLFLYNKEKAYIWGDDEEYISSPRLDDLECVFTSLQGFINASSENNINVLAIFDNEEVGSLSYQGARSDFLLSIIKRINYSLGLNEEDLNSSIARSFVISSDNAHAIHPNFAEKYDDNNKVYMNKGIAIKFNAAQSYASDGKSSALIMSLCNDNDLPYQIFSNRPGTRGGSTLGNLLLNNISPLTVDIGLGQLAMHSSYETAGTKDVLLAIKLFKSFYNI